MTRAVNTLTNILVAIAVTTIAITVLSLVVQLLINPSLFDALK